MAISILLLLGGIGGISFGLYALLRGGRGERGRRDERGGIGPISERGIHLVAGVRMLVVGILGLAAGAYVLWSYLD